eukprot:tig00000194_g14788.t1
MASGTKPPLVCSGHSRPIPEIRFSNVTEDGIFLISACLDGKPMLRNGETGDWIGTFEGHKGAVWSACLNTPATHAATASADFTVKLWNAISGEEMHSFKHGHIVKAVDFQHDGSRIVTGGHEKCLRLWDVTKPEAEVLKIEGLPNIIKTAVFAGPAHSDNLVFVGLQEAGGVHVVDVRTKQVIKVMNTPAPVTSIELSQDGKHIATACGKEAGFFSIATFEPVKSFAIGAPVESVALHPDNKRFIAGCTDNWVRVMDFESGKELECLKGHHGPVHCTRISPKQDTFASGSLDGTIRIWSYSNSPSNGLPNGG